MLRVPSTVPSAGEAQGEQVKVPAPKLYSGVDSLGLRAIRGKEKRPQALLALCRRDNALPKYGPLEAH